MIGTHTLSSRARFGAGGTAAVVEATGSSPAARSASGTPPTTAGSGTRPAGTVSGTLSRSGSGLKTSATAAAAATSAAGKRDAAEALTQQLSALQSQHSLSLHAHVRAAVLDMPHSTAAYYPLLAAPLVVPPGTHFPLRVSPPTASVVASLLRRLLDGAATGAVAAAQAERTEPPPLYIQVRGGASAAQPLERVQAIEEGEDAEQLDAARALEQQAAERVAAAHSTQVAALAADWLGSLAREVLGEVLCGQSDARTRTATASGTARGLTQQSLRRGLQAS